MLVMKMVHSQTLDWVSELGVASECVGVHVLTIFREHR